MMFGIGLVHRAKIFKLDGIGGTPEQLMNGLSQCVRTRAQTFTRNTGDDQLAASAAAIRLMTSVLPSTSTHCSLRPHQGRHAILGLPVVLQWTRHPADGATTEEYVEASIGRTVDVFKDVQDYELCVRGKRQERRVLERTGRIGCSDLWPQPLAGRTVDRVVSTPLFVPNDQLTVSLPRTDVIIIRKGPRSALIFFRTAVDPLKA